MELLTAIGLVTVKAVALSMAIVASADKLPIETVCQCTNNGNVCVTIPKQ